MILIFDMDGVIYRGHQRIPGAAEALSELKKAGHAVYFLTNNSTKTREAFLEKLESMEIKTDVAHIITSSFATAEYLKNRVLPGTSSGCWWSRHFMMS